MQLTMVLVLFTGVLLMATSLQVSATNTKIELTSERVWRTDDKAFVSGPSLSYLVSSKLRYYANSKLSGLYIKSIDDRSEPVDCAISSKTIESLNLQGFYNIFGIINTSINFLFVKYLVDFGSKLLLVTSLTSDLVIIDPKSCSVETVIYRNDTCSRIIANSDSFDCLVTTTPPHIGLTQMDITRYDEKGQAIRSLNAEFTNGRVSEFRRLEEPYGDVVYYALKDQLNDETELTELNATYGIVRETPLGITDHYSQGFANFDHDRITRCQFPGREWFLPGFLYIEKTDYALVHCKWAEIKNPSKIVEFSFNITRHGVEKYDPWYLYVKNLKRGAFIIFRANKSGKLFYRYVNEAGVIDDENQLFYELDEHLDRQNLYVKIYEINDEICTQLHSGGNYIYTRCVKLLYWDPKSSGGEDGALRQRPPTLQQVEPQNLHV